MQYSFSCIGHENITAKHKTTLEFSKDKKVSLNGDCILGVEADFDLPLVKEFIKSLKGNKIEIIIRINSIEEKINAEINPQFNSNNELVIRKTDFVSERTFAIKADKSAADLSRRFVKFINACKNRIDVVFLCR